MRPRFLHLAEGWLSESSTCAVLRPWSESWLRIWPGSWLVGSLIEGLVLGGILFALGNGAFAAETRETDFATDIRPIFKQHCFGCHGESEREGGLRLTNRRDAFTDGDSGQAAIVPGKPDASSIFQRITSSDLDMQMPPPGEQRERLTAKQVAVLRDWIAAGADWPADADAETTETKHWAYLRPIRQQKSQSVSSPVAPPADASNPIDHFIALRLGKDGMTMANREKPARLIRRVTLALTGLPPTPDQVAAFVADPSPAAYETHVDALLASPRYGERWAQPWLDLARYADSNGFQADQLRDSWAYRDWVIESMNTDQPFDQFVIEQLAGDLLPNATVAQKIATGFHRATTCNVEAGVHPEENRVNQIFDRVNTTGTVFLGTTIECCQCHNHKYDPFTQDEYYQLFAFFNNTPLEVKKESGVQWNFYGPKLDLPNSQALIAQREKIEADIEQLQQEQSAAKKSDPDIKTKIKKKIKEQNAKLAALPTNSTLVMTEMEDPRETRKLMRGDYLNPGKQLQPGVPAVLHPMRDDLPKNRLGLAQWITDPENPLLGRVTVNRWWAEFFGRGLVATPEDFGTQADPPSHPQLLDWLANQLTNPADKRWSRKRIHKLIVMSATFQQSGSQSSLTTSEGTKTDRKETDPTNKLYARGPRFRMPAEMIRDNGLAISGLLSNRLGGPPVMPYQPDRVWRAVGRNAPKWQSAKSKERFRRGVYVVWRRAAPYPSFVNFDAPDRASCVVERPRTNTPLQALTLLNDQAYLEMALALADQVCGESDDVRDRIRLAFRRCVARDPNNEEVAILEALYETESQRLAEDKPAANKLIQSIKKASGQQVAYQNAPELAAFLAVTNALLNLDETINY